LGDFGEKTLYLFSAILYLHNWRKTVGIFMDYFFFAKFLYIFQIRVKPNNINGRNPWKYTHISLHFANEHVICSAKHTISTV